MVFCDAKIVNVRPVQMIRKCSAGGIPTEPVLLLSYGVTLSSCINANGMLWINYCTRSPCFISG